MKIISLKVPEELVSRLDAIARARRISRSALLREALEAKLMSAARKTPPSLYEQSSDLCGMGNSGMGDLASNPKHLDEVLDHEIRERIIRYDSGVTSGIASSTAFNDVDNSLT